MFVAIQRYEDLEWSSDELGSLRGFRTEEAAIAYAQRIFSEGGWTIVEVFDDGLPWRGVARLVLSAHAPPYFRVVPCQERAT